ncbi:hypothetical protein F6Q07_22625, partial [Pectobacterium parmentieri]|nr:hypothetical protein [Pectobacterium parmentieri]
MAQFGGLQGLGGPIDYFGMATAPATQILNDSYRNDALEASTAAQRFETQQAQKSAAQQQALMQELPGAMSDPAKLQALAIKYPSQLKNIQAQLGFKNAQDVDATEKAVNALQQASSMGPEAV